MKRFVGELARSAAEHDLSGLAAQLAFRFMHSMLWVLVFLTAAGGFVAPLIGGPHPADRLMQTVFSELPEDIRAVLGPQLHRLMDSHSPALLAVGAASALGTGAVAFMALIKSLDQVHEVNDDRPLRARALVALGLTVSIGIALLAAFTLLLVQQLAGHAIADALGIGPSAALALRLAAVALVLVALVGATAVLYRVTPRDDSGARWVTIGAGVFVAVWVVATTVLAFYLSHFGAYANAYGVLGALIVVCSWFYLTSFALLLGAEVDVLLEAQAAEAGTHQPRVQPATQSPVSRARPTRSSP